MSRGRYTVDGTPELQLNDEFYWIPTNKLALLVVHGAYFDEGI